MTSLPNPGDLGLPRSRFPGYRPGQESAILSLASGGDRFAFLQAPTGSGKSLIYCAMAKLLDARVLILTGTKQLQSQLLADFAPAGMVDIRGHRNYPCAEDAPGRFDPVCTAPRDKCDYNIATERARSSQVVSGNYAYWLSLARYGNPSLLGDFDILVLDEAHSAPDWLAEFCSVTLMASELRGLLGLPLPKLGHTSQWSPWAEEATEVARAKYREVRDSGPSPQRAFRMQQLTELTRDLTELARVRRTPDIRWVAQQTRTGAKFSPVWGYPYAEQYLFRRIPNVVLCSATLPPDIGRYLAIGEGEREYVEVPSSFHHRRRPFIYLPIRRRDGKIVRVDSRMDGEDVRLWLAMIDEIVSSRLPWKGIIHSLSYARMKQIYESSRYAEYMIVHRSGGAAEAMREFCDSPSPRILVSPSMEEGVDFVGDLCRWQIVAKVPFADSRDPVTKARMDEDRGYGKHVAGMRLEQMAGRPMRSTEDWAETFIIDGHWAWFRREAWFSRSFRRAWVEVGNGKVPKPLGEKLGEAA